jgi:Uma2 family endonuclease
MATATRLLTAEEYGQLPDDGRRTELLRGVVVELAIPFPRHGEICSKIARAICGFADERRLGHVLTNNSGLITRRGPDTVRGPDVAFYSFARVPPGRLPWEYLTAVPELVFEARSPGDRWRAVFDKVNEYLKAGVGIVCVVDDPTERALVFDDDGIHPLTRDDALEFPKLLPGFSVPVWRLFE